MRGGSGVGISRDFEGRKGLPGSDRRRLLGLSIYTLTTQYRQAILNPYVSLLTPPRIPCDHPPSPV